MSQLYSDRPMWLYSRSSDKRMFVLIQQMRNLLSEAKHREYTVVGTSQDMGTGRSMARMGLKQMMQAVQGGFVRAVLVRDLTRLSHDPAILIQILEFLQDHDTVLITTESDLRYELYLKGLENRFFQRAAQKGPSFTVVNHHGNPYTLQTPSEKVINEIKYFAAFSALKRLLEQEKITLENCQQANVAIAEKYGVSQLHI
jgi:hypothetical protein